jgi:hypothetical protein
MIAIVAHDAGGAEIVSSYVRQRNLHCVFSLGGPAQRIFEQKLGIHQSVSVGEAIMQCEWLLCGTSWQSDLEIRGIELARTKGKKSVAFIDHWQYYSERFTRSGERHLPDEIWVGDKIAELIARSCLPDITTKLIPNPYFIDVKKELTSKGLRIKKPVNTYRFLYVSEPVKEFALTFLGNELVLGYSDEDPLRLFLADLLKTPERVEEIIIRAHPSESINKYDWVLAEFDLPIRIDRNRGLVESISNCDIVVGCESMAMVVGLLAEKRVISCIPRGGRACSLPHPEIEHFQLMQKILDRPKR